MGYLITALCVIIGIIVGCIILNFSLGWGIAIIVCISVILPAIIGGLTTGFASAARSYREHCFQQKARLKTQAEMILKEASCFLKGNIDSENNIKSIDVARKRNYSFDSLTEVIVDVYQNCPNDDESRSEWEKVMKKINNDYEEIHLKYRGDYNEQVRFYKELFTPVVRFLLRWLVKEDKTISYYGPSDDNDKSVSFYPLDHTKLI